MTNPTLLKFAYPESLIQEWENWAVLVRPVQVTLGSLVLAARGEWTAYSQLPDAAFREQALAVRAIETALADFCSFERINYLMLMMVDPNVHFHVVPRYSQPREWSGETFADQGWPGAPQLQPGVVLAPAQLVEMRDKLKTLFCSV
ncbi:MAG TPA: HIT family protein [Sphingomicrobium sp.]|nr:HIT family protein [Sphingomicrobium sp.]